MKNIAFRGRRHTQRLRSDVMCLITTEEPQSQVPEWELSNIKNQNTPSSQRRYCQISTVPVLKCKDIITCDWAQIQRTCECQLPLQRITNNEMLAL